MSVQNSVELLDPLVKVSSTTFPGAVPMDSEFVGWEPATGVPDAATQKNILGAGNEDCGILCGGWISTTDVEDFYMSPTSDQAKKWVYGMSQLEQDGISLFELSGNQVRVEPGKEPKRPIRR